MKTRDRNSFLTHIISEIRAEQAAGTFRKRPSDTVTITTTEAEYYALPRAAAEIIRMTAFNFQRLPNGRISYDLANYRVAEIEEAIRRETQDA
jgi:hypothetical protein